MEVVGCEVLLLYPALVMLDDIVGAEERGRVGMTLSCGGEARERFDRVDCW